MTLSKIVLICLLSILVVILLLGLIVLSLFFIFLEIILLVLFFRKLPPYIPFFNSMPWGGLRLADPKAMLYLLSSFIVVVIVNNFLGTILYSPYSLTSRILSITSLLFVFLGFLASVQIFILVF